ncbi:ADP-ribosyltransferase [Schinkia azotoformans]|nr:ADP-ribosyltransferase [Schinkia azotoformans]MEC1695992.1 ADP-ribosyltransferase [Schinkia azotoformans]MEC1773405.1 ADP-ribosyltransferase [Schinkia azotoformans]
MIIQFGDRIIKMMNKKRYGEIHWSIDKKKEYREFQNATEAQDWGMAHYKNWADQYMKVMQMAKNIVKNSLYIAPLECYCGYSYRQINEFLRYDSDNENHTYRELSDILSIVLCSAPRVPCNLVLYRMVNDEFINMLVAENKRDIPTPVHEKGFMSTSLLKNIANEDEPYAAENNLLKIYVPKDTSGVYVNAVTRRSEEEMLLSPNMFLGLASYPYYDQESGKKVFECQLINFYI